MSAKVKIVREYHKPVRPSEVHNFGIKRLRITDIGPVGALNIVRREELHPGGGEIHVDDNLHFEESWTSNSSARHAAYASASVMSSFSR